MFEKGFCQLSSSGRVREQSSQKQVVVTLYVDIARKLTLMIVSEDVRKDGGEEDGEVNVFGAR